MTELNELTRAGEIYRQKFIDNIPNCSECNKESGFHVLICVNGSTQNRAVCYNESCIRYNKIVHFNDRRQSIKNVEVWHMQDPRMNCNWVLNTTMTDKDGFRPACEYGKGTKFPCESADMEYHHFGVKRYFADNSLWPTAWLCKSHHEHWHDVMTPGLVHDDMDHYSWNWDTLTLHRYRGDYKIPTDFDDLVPTKETESYFAAQDLLIETTKLRYQKLITDELYGTFEPHPDYDDAEKWIPGTLDALDDGYVLEAELSSDYKYKTGTFESNESS